MRGHRPAVRVGQRDLALTAALQFLEHSLVARFALLRRRDLLGQVLRPTVTRPILLGIGPVEAAQIVGQALVRRADHRHQLLTGEVAVGAIDRFQPGPVDGEQFSLNSHAKCNAGIDRSCDGSEV